MYIKTQRDPVCFQRKADVNKQLFTDWLNMADRLHKVWRHVIKCNISDKGVNNTPQFKHVSCVRHVKVRTRVVVDEQDGLLPRLHQILGAAAELQQQSHTDSVDIC